MKKLLIVLCIFMTTSVHADYYLNGMTEVYEHLEAKHKNDKIFMQKLELAKIKWKQFIEAQTELMYFDHGGTLAPMCMESYKFSLDVAIANETKYLFYYEDGDSCSGRG